MTYVCFGSPNKKNTHALPRRRGSTAAEDGVKSGLKLELDFKMASPLGAPVTLSWNGA